MRLIKNKGFTLIELLVTIAVIGVLVLLGIPRFTSHIQEAELTRIQHDVRVMEEEMKIILLENEKIEGFDYNTKDLGLLIEANRLFEKEGHAEVLEYVPAKGEINGLSSKERKLSSKTNIGGVEYSTYGGLGVGGDEIQIEEEFKEMYERYKIIPDEYTDKIKTRLKGTFYTNDNGKVYYEPDKQNKIKTEPKALNCNVALPDYEFEQETGKIIKYIGTEQHLIIPSHFLIDGECVPVRVIGEGAFMQGGFKSIMIPPSVLAIERNAFKESGVDSIIIPGSVREIGQGAFDGIEDVVYLGGSSRVNNGTGAGTYLAPDGTIKNVVHRHPSASEASVVFHPESGTIVRGSNKGSGVYIPEYINIGGRDVKVRKIAKGAYQGLGLITVILPETLEIIEDYAFSGNQLIGVTIPNSVYHIGHYAFSFNEVWHEDNEDDRKATIKTVIIKEEEQFNKIDKVGDIVKDGIKVNLFEANSGELGPAVKLLNHIWVTSIGNIVIDVKYGPVGSGDEVIPEGYEMAELEDFEFVPNSSAPNEYHENRGYYRYVGNKEYVVIPHIIQDIGLKDYYKMFEGSKVKGVASDNKNVNNMAHMFYNSASTSIELKYLDTSSVTNMSWMFRESKATTLDLSSFDTSSVTDMRIMFHGSQATTLDLSSFDTSSVTDMRSMFQNSQATTLDLSSFDTSSVTDMGYMFQNSQATTGYARTVTDAGKFNSASGKPAALTFVVKGNSGNPQPPTNKPDGYVIAKQEDFQFVLNSDSPNSYNGVKGYYKYVGTDDKIVVPHIIYGNEIKDYYKMFEGSSVKGVASDNKNVSDMSRMFYNSVSTSIELKYLDTSSVTNMSWMFRNSKATTLDLSSFDTSSVTDMRVMFSGSQATILDLSSFDTSSVTDMGNMFYGSQATTLDLSSFDTSSVTNMGNMFPNTQATTGYARTSADAGKFNDSSNKPSALTFVVKGDLDKPQPPTNKPDGYVIAKQEDFQFIVSNEAPNTYNGTKGHYKYVGIDDKIVVPHIIYGNEIKDYYKMFEGSSVKGVASDNKNVSDMSRMFYNSVSTAIELKYLDTSSVTNMSWMFRNSKATTLDLSSFDTSSVTDMRVMFQSSQATTLDLSSFDTSSVTDMGNMFYGSQAITLDLSSFDTSSVTNMNWMFRDSKATTLDLSSFDTSSVTTMASMFSNSKATTGYARTSADAGKFNSVSGKPATLTFVVK